MLCGRKAVSRDDGACKYPCANSCSAYAWSRNLTNPYPALMPVALSLMTLTSETEPIELNRSCSWVSATYG